MFLKIMLTGAAVAFAMVGVRDGRLPARAGLIGGCTQIATRSDDSAWQVCKHGRLDDFPNLTNKSCVSFGVKGNREFWRCPASLVSSQVPRA